MASPASLTKSKDGYKIVSLSTEKTEVATLPSDPNSQVDGVSHKSAIQNQTSLSPPLTISKCVLAFTLLNFDTANYDRYPEFFHDDSVLILPQAGEYKGAADMEEYMRFPSVSSPWLLEADSVAKKVMVHSVDQDTRKCTFLLYETGLFKLDKSTVQEGSLLLNSLFKLTYS